LFAKIFLDGLACRLPVFLRKGERSQNRYTQMLDFIGEKGKEQEEL
jgi:hypothetical protein